MAITQLNNLLDSLIQFDRGRYLWRVMRTAPQDKAVEAMYKHTGLKALPTRGPFNRMIKRGSPWIEGLTKVAKELKPYRRPRILSSRLDDLIQFRSVTWEDNPLYPTDIKSSVQEVPIKHIISHQETVKSHVVKEYKKKPGKVLPTLHKIGRKYFVEDGNHRIVAKKEKGEKTVRARVFEKELISKLDDLIQFDEPQFVRIKVEGGLQHHYIRDKRWGDPAGRIEPNETPEQAAHRELIERTGHAAEKLEYQGKDVDGVHVFHASKVKKIGPPQTQIRWKTPRRLSAQLDNLIEFKTLYQPKPGDEPPEELPVFKKGTIIDYNVQRHHAKRAGLHRDIRIGTPRHGLLSWVTRKHPPAHGEKVAIHAQPTHPHSYLGWSGDIAEGYGAGKVETTDLGKALVTKSTPSELHATLADRKGSHRLAFIKTKSGWLLSKGKHPQPPEGAQKPPAKVLDPREAKGHLAELPPGTSVQPKVDGALVYIATKSGRPEIFSHRVSKTTGKHPVHTERVFHGRPTVDIPREHQRTLIGELYGKIRGKAIPPQELGGLLNAHIHESIRKQKASGVKLKVMPFDYVDGKDEQYAERLAKVKQTLKHLPGDVFHAPEEAKTPQAALRLHEQIRSGRHPLTSEGLIVHEPHGTMKKIKFMKETNVKIAGTFPGTGKFEGHPGGFYYADKSGKPIGRVGTGFSDESRRELEKFVGRTARIKHQGRYKSGAYRAPSFIAIDEAR